MINIFQTCTSVYCNNYPSHFKNATWFVRLTKSTEHRIGLDDWNHREAKMNTGQIVFAIPAPRGLKNKLTFCLFFVLRNYNLHCHTVTLPHSDTPTSTFPLYLLTHMHTQSHIMIILENVTDEYCVPRSLPQIFVPVSEKRTQRFKKFSSPLLFGQQLNLSNI